MTLNRSWDRPVSPKYLKLPVIPGILHIPSIRQSWAVRHFQHQFLFIPLCSWQITPSFRHPTGCICLPTTCPASTVSAPFMRSSCTSGLWVTLTSLFRAVPSPSCPAWWTPAFLYPRFLCSPTSSSPPSRIPLGRTLEHLQSPNPVLTSPTWQRPPRRMTP